MKITTILVAALLVAATISSNAQSVGPGPVPVGSAGAKNLGVSVTDPGTGNLEYVLPTQAITGTSHTFTASDLYKKTRRSNSGSAMSDTLPASSASGLTNGTRINIDNVDATAIDTLTAGGGTSIASGCSSVGPGRDVLLVYDQTTATWRGDVNGCTSLLSANNLSDVANAGTARSNLGVAIGVNVEAWSSNLDAFALKTAPSGSVVGTTDSQVLNNKTISGSSNTLSNIAPSSVAAISANTIIANVTGSSASPTAATPGALSAILCQPQVTVYTSGSGTYTTPTCNNAVANELFIRMVGPGGSSAGSGTGATAAGSGTATTFGSSFLTASAGGGGTVSGAGGSGGSATGGDINLPGGSGGGAGGPAGSSSATGCASPFGSPGSMVQGNAASPGLAATGYGSGASGATGTASPYAGGSGACGGYLEKTITSPSSSYPYAVGAPGTAGAAGTSGAAGALGGSGVIIIRASWQ